MVDRRHPYHLKTAAEVDRYPSDVLLRDACSDESRGLTGYMATLIRKCTLEPNVKTYSNLLISVAVAAWLTRPGSRLNTPFITDN